MLWLLATAPRRIGTALVLAELGVFFAVALHDVTSLAWFALGGAAIVGVPMTRRWRQADDRRRAAELAEELDAGGLHETAARLRTATTIRP